MTNVRFYILFILSGCLLFSSCLNFVEDGLEVEYGPSEASFTVVPIGSSSAAANETVSFSITAKAPGDIKSCVVRTSVEGKNGSGYNVADENFDDPFADHNFGTIRTGINEFTIRYDYIIPDDLNRARITFTLVDESGKVSEQEVITAVPTLSYHEEIIAYSKDRTFHDAIASSEGQVYENIKDQYSTLTTENLAVQEKIDIIFIYDVSTKNAIITNPASGGLNLELQVENQTLFQRVERNSELRINELTAGEFETLTNELDLSNTGTSSVDFVRVNDLIAFIADVNAPNSLKKGLLKVTNLHPGNVARYSGISYVLECEIVVQN